MNEEAKIKLRKSRQIDKNHLAYVSLMYAPLMGSEVTNLYFTLVSVEDHLHITNTKLLLALCSCSIHRFTEMREQLEQYQLLRTYQNVKDQSYTLDIQAPLEPEDFFQHPILSRIFLYRMKEQAFDFIRTNMQVKGVEEGYYEISKTMDQLVKEWKDEDEDNYQKVKGSSTGYEHLLEKVNFDFASFLDHLSEMVLPTNKRTNKNLLEIGTMASLYAVPAKEMRKIVAKSYNYHTGFLDFEKMKEFVYRYSGTLEIVTIENEYAQSPTQFLRMKQNGIEVSEADKRLIDLLISKYKMKPEVVNVLLEYSLEQTNQRLTKSYVEKIASTWIRKKVDSIESAKEACNEVIQKPKNVRRGKQESVPKWYFEEEQQKEVDETKLEALLKRVKNKEDKE